MVFIGCCNLCFNCSYLLNYKLAFGGFLFWGLNYETSYAIIVAGGAVSMSKSSQKHLREFYNSLEKEKIALYEQYISNAKCLDLLSDELDELKDNKRRKDDRDAKVYFGLWIGWLAGMLTSLVLRIAGLPDLSLWINVGAVAFLVPNVVNKILQFPQKKSYVAKKTDLRDKIMNLENENKKITETLIDIKNEQTKALLNAKTTEHSSEFENLANQIKNLKKQKALNNQITEINNKMRNMNIKEVLAEKEEIEK